MNGIGKSGGSHEVQPGRTTSVEQNGSHKGKKITRNKNPFKFIVKAFTSPFKKSNKTVAQRSVSLPNLSDQTNFVSSGLKKSQSAAELKSSQPALNSYSPLTEKTRIPGPVYSGPSEGGRRQLNAEATANNTIRQLDVLEKSSKTGAQEPLDPKSLAVLFKETLTQPLVADKLVAFSRMLAEDGRDTRSQVYEQMKHEADTVVDEVLKQYPNIEKRLSREGFKTISQSVQASVLEKMSVDVWTTPKADIYAESVEADFRELSRWAHEPHRVTRPRTKGAIEAGKFAKKLNQRKAAGVETQLKQVTPTQADITSKARPLQRRVVTTTATLETKTTVTGPSRQIISGQTTSTGSVAKPVESQQQAGIQQADPVVQKENNSIARQFQQAVQSSQDFLNNELTTDLPADIAGVAHNVYRNVRATGVSEDQARSVALLFKDSINSHNLTTDQALAVAVEASNWLNDEADYASDLVFSASQGLIEWLKAGEEEGAAVQAMTDWLEDESWEDRGDISDTLSAKQPQGASDMPDNSGQLQDSESSVPPPPPPPPPPLPQTQETTKAGRQSPEQVKTETVAREVNNSLSGPGGDDARGALLSDIRKGMKLKKTDAGTSVDKIKNPDGMEAVLSRRITTKTETATEDLAKKLANQVGEFKFDFDEPEAADILNLRLQLMETLKGSGFGKELSSASEESTNIFLQNVIGFEGSDKDMERLIEEWAENHLQG